MDALEHNVTVTRHARYLQLGECGPQTRRLWVVLHGYGQLASYFIKHFEALADAETCIVAPEGLSRFYLDSKWDRVGASWMTREDRLHEIEDYLGYLDRVLEKVQGQWAPEVVLLGFSQGTATAWRWAMRGQVSPRQLILWAGGPAMDSLQAAPIKLAHCPLHVVLGDQDEFVTIAQAEQQLESLRKLKPDTRFWTFQGGHRIDGPTLGSIQASF